MPKEVWNEPKGKAIGKKVTVEKIEKNGWEVCYKVSIYSPFENERTKPFLGWFRTLSAVSSCLEGIFTFNGKEDLLVGKQGFSRVGDFSLRKEDFTPPRNTRQCQ